MTTHTVYATSITFLFNFSLLNDAVSDSDNTASNGSKILNNECEICEEKLS